MQDAAAGRAGWSVSAGSVIVCHLHPSPRESTVNDDTPSRTTVPRSRIRQRLKDAIATEPPARARILAAAIKVFQKKGLASSSVEDLLVAAPASRGSFYQYFQNKHDVAAALFRHMQQLLIILCREASGGERQPAVRLQNTFRVYLQAQEDLGGLYAMLLAEAKQPGSALAAARWDVLETATALIERSLLDMQGRAVEPDVIRALLLAMEELTLLVYQRSAFSAQQAEHIRRVMLPIIQRALALPGDSLMELPLRES